MTLKEVGREKGMGFSPRKSPAVHLACLFLRHDDGSAFYDSSFINQCLAFVGINYSFTAETLVKAPVLLTFISSLVVLIAALGMKDKPPQLESYGHRNHATIIPHHPDRGIVGMENTPTLRHSSRIHGSR